MLDQWMKVDGKIGCARSRQAAVTAAAAEMACQSILTLLINFGFTPSLESPTTSTEAPPHFIDAISVREPRDETIADIFKQTSAPRRMDRRDRSRSPRRTPARQERRTPPTRLRRRSPESV